ncbi:hypothetical protein [uncultured Paraglaciecola sp.]|uniref:hypothetical protein n=1 Tax=uncultured Paraglaciecola sp. TaxID=1765024 RepID=UPI00261909CB|nr:hypothetical protein [uncultured Paraglaciecola sp.]
MTENERAINNELKESFKVLMEAAIEYCEYQHDGDPWTEDSRAMGEMMLDDIKSDGRLEKYKRLLRKLDDSLEKYKTLT